MSLNDAIISSQNYAIISSQNYADAPVTINSYCLPLTASELIVWYILCRLDEWLQIWMLCIFYVHVLTDLNYNSKYILHICLLLIHLVLSKDLVTQTSYSREVK